MLCMPTAGIMMLKPRMDPKGWRRNGKLMKRGIGFLLSLAMLLAALGPIGAGAAVAKAAEGDMP